MVAKRGIPSQRVGARMRQVADRPPLHPPPERSHASTGAKSGSKRLSAPLRGALLAATLLVAACGGGSEEPPAPQPTTPPQPPAAASPAAAAEPAPRPPATRNAAQQSLDEAARLEHEGFWELATVERRLALDSEAAAHLSAEVLQDALLTQARLLLRLDRPDEAAAVLDQLERDPVPGDAVTLLSARVLAAQGRDGAAADAYAAYVEGGGAASHRARLEAARLRDAYRESEDALREYEAVSADPTAPALDVERALLEGGLVLENLGRYAEADAWYQRLAETSPWVSDDTFALHRSAIVRLESGNRDGAAEAWTRLLRDFPWHPLAVAAYDGLLAAGLPVASLSEGLYLYRQLRYDDAREVYEGFLAGAPWPAEEAEARYYLAAIDEDSGFDEAAIAGYLAAANRDPASPLADDALWWAARLLEEGGSQGLARLTYERLAADYPESSFAGDAAFRAALTRYLGADLSGAEAAFQALSGTVDRAEAQRAWLWLGKSRLAANRTAAAVEAFQAALERDPSSYYGLRAAAHLAQAPLSPALLAPGPTTEARESPSAIAWLTAMAGPEPTDDALAASADWQAALDLWQAGLGDAAAARFRLALARLDDPWGRYRAGQALDALGLVHLRLEAAIALLETAPPVERPEAPPAILRWAYPEGWPRLARAEAHSYELDDLLLYALIRQESRFNPDAGSIAGALGLTQVIPGTAADIAAALGDDGFELSLLFRPERSIRYGAFYLDAQLQTFDGSAWIALAAYNGGPGNAARWADGGAATDPDLFFERVDFRETRLYLQLVLENYAWYQYVYRGSNAPTLVTATGGDAGALASPR